MFANEETKIITRLQARLPAGVHVGVLEDVVKVPELRQKAPAVWLIYDGYTLGAQIPNVPQLQQIAQNWFVVIATKSAKGAGGIDAAKAEASSLCTTVIEALLGFDMGGGKRLRMEEAPGPEYDGGYCHVPLAFSNPATFKGTP